MLRAPYVKVTESAREESKKKRALEDSNIIKGWACITICSCVVPWSASCFAYAETDREREEQAK